MFRNDFVLRKAWGFGRLSRNIFKAPMSLIIRCLEEEGTIEVWHSLVNERGCVLWIKMYAWY